MPFGGGEIRKGSRSEQAQTFVASALYEKAMGEEGLMDGKSS